MQLYEQVERSPMRVEMTCLVCDRVARCDSMQAARTWLRFTGDYFDDTAFFCPDCQKRYSEFVDKLRVLGSSRPRPARPLDPVPRRSLAKAKARFLPAYRSKLRPRLSSE